MGVTSSGPSPTPDDTSSHDQEKIKIVNMQINFIGVLISILMFFSRKSLVLYVPRYSIP